MNDWSTAEQTALSEALARARGVLSGARQVALACHTNPDPDAAGSMLGLAVFLSALGKEVVCSWGNEPLEAPAWLGLLDGGEFLVSPSQFPTSPAVMVALDTASPDRLGALAANAERAGELVVIDHHATNPGFGSVVLLDPSASSTAELTYRLIERMDGQLPDGAAACLYAGLVTDTGRFQYQASTAETLRVAAELRKHPFDHVRMGQELFDHNSFNYLRFLAVALERLEYVPETSLVWTYVMQGDLGRRAVGMAETDNLIDVVRTAKEADAACVIKQQRDGRFKVSLRSKGRTDVGSVAQSLGGGGHRLAAGYTSETGLEETVRTLVGTLSAFQGG